MLLIFWADGDPATDNSQKLAELARWTLFMYE
jgi:hypothetical protein